MPVTVKNFYKTRITNHGIVRTAETHAVNMPQDESSDSAEESDDDELDFVVGNTPFAIESETEEEIIESEDEDENLALADIQKKINCSSSSKNREVDEEEDEEEDEGPKTKEKKTSFQSRWRKRKEYHVNSIFVGNAFEDPPENLPTPIVYFKKIFDGALMATIVEQTNLYSVQVTGKSINTTCIELEKFLGIFIFGGLLKYPQYRMYWNSYTSIPAISESMSVNRFENLKRFFHVSNNELTPRKGSSEYDPLYKVRPMLDSVVEKCRNITPEECHSIDEQMVPTKARSSIRQYLPSKPHKWGYKIWARCGVSGIVYDFDVYLGKDDRMDCNIVKEYGKVGTVVIKLTETLERDVNHKVYMDNLFSSMKLFRYLKDRGFWCVGTIRANRLDGAGALMKNKKQLEKEGRGATDYRCDANSNIVIMRWLDNGLVQLISSFVGSAMGDPVKRWSGKEKRILDVPCPEMVHQYNKHMGGVDKCDMLMALYRINIRTKKWYMHLVYYCVGVSVVNAWLLYRRHCAQKGVQKKDVLALKDFQSRIAIALLQGGKVSVRGRGRPSTSTSIQQKSKTSATVPIPAAEIRCDNVGHFPEFTEKQGRCRFCPKGWSSIQCSKCKIKLCLVKDRNCFLDFHKC